MTHRWFSYVECDVPPGLLLTDWRRGRNRKGNVCHRCKGVGKVPHERDERSWPVSWIGCGMCLGTGRVK